MSASMLFQCPDVMDIIAAFLPPDNVHVVGSLNKALYQSSRFNILKKRYNFALANLLYTDILDSVSLRKFKFIQMGECYIAALFTLYGFNYDTLALLYKDASHIRACVCDVPWSSVMPDELPTHSNMIMRAFQKSYSCQRVIPLLDADFVMIWSSYFGLFEICKNSITVVMAGKIISPFVSESQDIWRSNASFYFNNYLISKQIESAFYFAYTMGHADIVRLLVMTDQINLSEIGTQALADSARLGHTSVVKILLEEFKIPVNSEGAGLALIWAAGNGYIEVVKVLINSGVRKSLAAMTRAKENCFADVVRFLQNHR